MEGGERKKKGPIVLDWDKLLEGNEEDSEQPQLVVEKAPAAKKKKKKKKWESVEMDDSGGDRDIDEEQSEQFRGLSDKELAEKIDRMKRNLPTFNLPDGGEKYRINIKRHEDEMERRRLLQRQKDDESSKKSPEFYDLSCSGTYGGSQEEAPSSLPSHRSEFNTAFLKKMEKKKEPVREDVFGKELSILNRCDGQSTRSNGHYSSMEKNKRGLSSRQTPFCCPSSLSIDVDKNLSNGDHKGTSPSLDHCKDDLATRVSKKRNFSQAQPSNNLRSNNTVVLVDEDEHETAETTQVDQDECMKEARIYYPSRDDPESMEIRYSDLECLAPEAYVSSTIMNFYIRYLQQHRYSNRNQVDYQFFNTYFYQKLKEAVRKNYRETTFAKVRRWWKGVKLFEKAYIFLPIHEQLHWSLVIICMPDKEAGRGPLILHLDSLGLHSSKSIFENIKRFLIGEWEFLRKEAHLNLPFSNRIWVNLRRRIDEKIVEVPQQKNEYDCGLFVLFFIERFTEKAPERVNGDLTMFGRQWFKPEEASRLRYTIRDLLKQEFKKAKENNCLLDA